MTRSIDEMIDFFLREKGEPIRLNGVDKTALINDATEQINNEDAKRIRMAIEMKTGDYIDYRNERYLLVSQIDRNSHSFRGGMRKCNHKIAFNWNGNVKWFDAVIESRTFSIETGKYMLLPNGKIDVLLQDSEDAKAVKLDQRFYIAHQPYKVEGIDRTHKGILKLSCTLDLINSDDDVENNIAGHRKMIASDNIEDILSNPSDSWIEGSPTIRVGLNTAYRCHVFKEGHQVSDQRVTWNLRNEDSTVPVIGSLIETADNGITIKVQYQQNYIGKYLILTATLMNDPTIQVEKTIQVKSLL